MMQGQQASSMAGIDPQVAQMNQFRSYVTMLCDPSSKDQFKLKAVQEITKNFETILESKQYPAFLEHSIKIFLKILQEGEPLFIAEYNIQQVRKAILEMIYRLPTNELLRPYVKPILSLMFRLLEIDNEENVLICLKIIIELHKQYRPAFNPEIQHFLKFVKTIYSELPKHMDKIFMPRSPITVKDLSELNIEELLKETFTITTIHTEQKTADDTNLSYYLIPKAVLSLKVLQELPIIVVLMYQLYKLSVHQDVADFLPWIMNTICLQPKPEYRESPNFNREVFVDFMGAQVKTLSFLAYIIKLYQEPVQPFAPKMVEGMLGLLALCPMEVAHLRRELLIAARHILATDLRNRFVPYMERLFDEDVLLGRGWTAHESLRPLAYSTLADLVHHVRAQLPFDDIRRAVYCFSKNIHDESLATTIQTMSTKLLLNLCECVRSASDAENRSAEGRDLLIRMLEVFVMKFKIIAKVHMPNLIAKCKQQQLQLQVQAQQQAAQQQAQQQLALQQMQQAQTGTSGSGNNGPETPTTKSVMEELKPDVKPTATELLESSLMQNGGATPTGGGSSAQHQQSQSQQQPPPTSQQQQQQKEDSTNKNRLGYTPNVNPYNVSDYRSLIKTLVCGVKTITWGIAACKASNPNLQTMTPVKHYKPHEILIYVRMVKWGLLSLDIYTLNSGPQLTGPQRLQQQALRAKEEKEVLEHFSGVFFNGPNRFHPQSLHEIFSATIDFLMEKMISYPSLQMMANILLSYKSTSYSFGSVLLEYLIERMEDMTLNPELSSLYLKLFKLVFGSVSLFPQQNERALKPHLRELVSKSMELAMSAKEPYNYFLLLRALFRSIGGGSHDLLYQEFLPLLPNLLEGLNRLQSGLHKQHMKDLFVELCLTVPVRLSSLLPYLPMLMDPLVSALNGSHVLISQGLRTLELCVDNLQHDFLYEHIQPVRADLMQALWRTLRNNDSVANVAFKVLGKFGGGNRKMMIEPQKLDYVASDQDPPAIITQFHDQPKVIEFPVQKIIETAFNALKQSNTDSYYRKQAWEVINSYLTASRNLKDDKNTMINLFLHPSFLDPSNIPAVKGSSYKSIYKQARETHQTALTGMFVAAAIKELRQPVITLMVSVVRHYTMVAVAQQAGTFAVTPKPTEQVALDPMVMVDALAIIMGHEEKELVKPGHVGMVLILDTASTLVGSKEMACRLPLIEYLAEKMCALCYERAWYAKYGGCLAISFLFEKGALKWVYEHMFTFLRALLFVMMDLTGEVSSGAVDMAKEKLEKMLIVLVTEPPKDSDGLTYELQKKAIYEVTHELVRQVTSPHTTVREQSMASLRLLAEKQNMTVTAMMEPFKDMLIEMTKHMLKHQPATAQIGLMDGHTFCMTLTPRLFNIDLSIKEHNLFIHDLLSLCEAEDAKLNQSACYKNITNFTALRKSALRVLASCYYLEEVRDKIFLVLYRALEKPNAELQATAFECTKQFIVGYRVSKELVHQTVTPLLSTLGDVKNLTLNRVKMLSYLTQLFPPVFKEKLCEQLLELLKQLLENLIAAMKGQTAGVSKKGEEEQKIITIIGLFHQTPAASDKFIGPLCSLILQSEKSMMIEANSPFRDVLMKFLLRYPDKIMERFLSESYIKEPQFNRFMVYLIHHKDGKPFREYLQTSMVRRLMQMVSANMENIWRDLGQEEKNEIQYQGVRIISLLVRHDDQWLAGQKDLVEVLKKLWCDDAYHERFSNIGNTQYHHWKEPRKVVKVLLHYFCHHPNNVELLFQLLRAFCHFRLIPEFCFLREFLNTVAQNYTVEWKRSAFFKYAELFHTDFISQELKAKVMQMILIPCFVASFEKGETNKLIGGPPSPYQDNSDNIVSIFINRIIDPENPNAQADCVRIALLQFSCLLVEQASPHVHDLVAGNKTQGVKLRRLMTFAWPCLLVENCVDPATRYHGHLLLSHIIDKFAIHRKIVLQVFHSLLKAHAMEARNVVRQALEILTPSMPVRMEEGNTMLTFWTKKIIVDEGHSMQQLYHILQLVVKHYKVYYPVRNSLVQYMVNSIQRLGFSPTATLEHRKLAVELCEVIIKWELNGIKEEHETPAGASQPSTPPTTSVGVAAAPKAGSSISGTGTSHQMSTSSSTTTDMSLKRSMSLEDPPSLEGAGGGTPQQSRKKLATLGGTPSQQPQPSTSFGTTVPTTTATAVAVKTDPDGDKPIDRNHIETVIHCLMRLACQVNEPVPQSGNILNSSINTGPNAPGELLSRRCVILLKTALKPDVWPQPIELKLHSFDKILQTVDSSTCNPANVCAALDLLTYLIAVMKKEQVLSNFKAIQRGLLACITCTNSKIIKSVHGLLIKLMSMFPTERSNNSQLTCKYEELEILYTTVGKVIFEGLNNYEKSAQANPSSLFATIMILRAACANNHSYIDLLITPFMRVLHRLAKEHLQPTATEYVPMTSELLMLSLDLVKTRVVVMGVEMRKTFIGTILVGLIEKTQDIKVMKCIIKILEEWIKCNKNVVTLNQAPSLREKSILLVKMMQYVEKRFPDDADLNAQFLDLICYVYTDPSLRATELNSKLEPAFMAGLRCTQPSIRAKFFKVFDESMQRRINDRLRYIAWSQNWENIGPHYWIKQCIELLLVTVVPGTGIQMAHESSILPSITSVINGADNEKKREFCTLDLDNSELLASISIKDEVVDLDLSAVVESNSTLEEKSTNRAETISQMFKKHYEFVEVSRNVTTEQFLMATAQLCHMDTGLAEQVWLDFFPRVWQVLDQDQRNKLAAEIAPFLVSGAHNIQKDCLPSAINTFVEALMRCNPPIQLKPPNMKYLAKNHNLWHRMALSLEQQALDPSASPKPSSATCYDFESDQSKNELFDSLGDLYANLCEEDLWAGLWQKHAHYKETQSAITYEQHGFFEQAQIAYDQAMNKYKQDCATGPVPTHTQREVLLWSNHYMRCLKELNEWTILNEYAKGVHYDPFLLMECAWKIPNWDAMKDALSNVEFTCPKELQWKVTMYNGFLAICQPDADGKQQRCVDKIVESSSFQVLAEWRRLPHIVSHIHLQYLQAAQQIMELHEANQIHKGLHQGHQNSLHDMKAIVKTWRNRLPVIADDLTHWNDIFTWRQHHYQVIVSHFEGIRDTSHQNSMLGVHASAQSIIHFGKIARKHKLVNVCLESLNRIYSITSVPIIDCYQKIRQQVKCYLQLASMNSTKSELQEGLDVINNTNVKYFAKDITADIYALKGMIYHLMGKSDEANKSFSAAVQMHDTSTKAWALYGDYLEQVFTRDPRQVSLGVNAMACFLHACRHQNESKARKYIAKILWLLNYEDDKSSLTEALDKYNVGVPPILWLPWTPQLLNWLLQYDSHVILNLLCQVGRIFPQAVYFPTRALYLTLRTATARKTNTTVVSALQQQHQQHQLQHQQQQQQMQHNVQNNAQEGDASNSNQSGVSTSSSGSASIPGQENLTSASNSTNTNATGGASSGSSGETSSIKATPAMIRCTKIMKMQGDIHPTVLSCLEEIANQMEWFRENWYEEVLRQLRQGLAKCYAIAFENRENVNEAKITPHISNFVKKLITTFGIGVENIDSVNVTFNSAASESLARRAAATYQDPVFKEMKQEFTKDFDFSQSNSMRLHKLIFKLKKWIKILDNRSKMLLQSFLMEEKCRFLANFTLKTAEVEMPGEFLLPKHSHYHVRITRFLPRVDVVQKHNAAARRLYIRGHNGKLYPYLVVIDSVLADARREERVLQLLRMLNHFLGRQKETSRRFLHFTVPRVVAVSQQIRLVEDNPSSISLLDIFKKGCTNLGIEHDDPIHYYYERLAQVQSRGIKASHQVYRDILKGVQTNMVPRTLLRQWALQTFPGATDYWHFRKMFTLQLALACFAEYVLHLTRLNPDMMYLHQDSGLMNISYFKFDVDDGTGELDTTRPVPFRLTPNIIEYLSAIGISGPLTASLIATARCLVYPNYRVFALIKPILRDEMVVSLVKKSDESIGCTLEKLEDNEGIVNMVNKAITAIQGRLNTLAHFDGVDGKTGGASVSALVNAANSHDNLCRMDPAWHPWL